MSEGSKTLEIMRELGMSLGQPMIAVVGCGGAGNNTVNEIYWNCQGIHTVVMNTDVNSLNSTGAHARITLGPGVKLPGYNVPDEVEKFTNESADEIRQALAGYEIVFVIAGLGGATGAGSAPVVARIAREEGAVVFAIPIIPFSVEGARRTNALESLEQLREVANVTVPIDNDKLMSLMPKLPIHSAFKVVNDSIVKIIERVNEHSTSYVSDLMDDVTGAVTPMEEIVLREHEFVLEEIPMTPMTADLMPSLEYPLDPEFQYTDLMFK